MATYGGGIDFVTTAGSVDLVFNNSSVVYTVPSGDKYTEFKTLSFKEIVASGSGTAKFVLQITDGAGGWMSASDLATATASGVVNTNTAGLFTITLHQGQRILATFSGISGTFRFNYVYNEYSPSN